MIFVPSNTPTSSSLQSYVMVRKIISYETNNNATVSKQQKWTKLFRQGILKLKYLYQVSQHLSFFSCNRPMSVYKTRNHIVKTCKFRLHTDMEKNPGPSLLLTDPWKTIKAPYSQGNELVFGQNAGQQCVAMS